jgi:hypothetical protein
MQAPTAPGWTETPVVAVAAARRREWGHPVHLAVALSGIALYLGLMIVGFYLGVCWVQHALNELTLSVRDLKNDLIALRSNKGG